MFQYVSFVAFVECVSEFFVRYFTDEIIRQVTINCAERGILLTRVRDEIEMTMIAYRTLYQSSIAFGIRKALQVFVFFYIL